jgi:hypothetical protein
MKNLTKNMTIAAAALVVAAGVAQAQTIKADIPFSFRAGGTVMPAGEYRVNARYSNGGIRVVQLTNTDTHTRRSTLAMPFQTNAPKPGSPEASLTFECGGAHCTLVQLAPGNGQAYKFPSPKPGRDEDTRVAVIRAVLVNGR